MKKKVGLVLALVLAVIIGSAQQSVGQSKKELGQDMGECMATAQLDLKLVYMCDSIEGIWNLSVPIVFSYNSGMLRIVRDNKEKLEELIRDGYLKKIRGENAELVGHQDSLVWLPINYRSFVMVKPGQGKGGKPKEYSEEGVSQQRMELVLTLQDGVEHDENNLRFNVNLNDLGLDFSNLANEGCSVNPSGDIRIPFESSFERERVKMSLLSGSNPNWKAIPIQVDDEKLVEYLLKPKGKISIKLKGEINLSDQGHRYRKSWDGTFTFTSAFWNPETGKSGPIQ